MVGPLGQQDSTLEFLDMMSSARTDESYPRFKQESEISTEVCIMQGYINTYSTQRNEEEKVWYLNNSRNIVHRANKQESEISTEVCNSTYYSQHIAK